MTRRRPAAPDQAQRDAAVGERRRNVLIDAGAGTGKTTILVERLVRMLAPPDDAVPVRIDRIAAITFTRKAAGELRLRIRERLLGELADIAPGSGREARLRDALAGLDTAWVGTIHAFADRLLRLRPIEARLSPSYEIVDDETALVRETVDVLLQAVESDTLAGELAGTPAAFRAAEATRTIVDALASGLPAGSRELEWGTRHGLDGLVAGLLGQRDVVPADDEAAPFDAEAFRRAAAKFVRLTRPVQGGTPGAAWILRMATTLRQLGTSDDPVTACREVKQHMARVPGDITRRNTFGDDDVAWEVWRTFERGHRGGRPLKEELLAPLDRWLATRLARLFPVVASLYEKVKTRHRALDQLDLLVKLRDLLRDDREVRREFQTMLDHVFVDEFQDTDPLQAEIVLFLCEREPRAGQWHEVALADGRLTLVGDPKQSIYRFRRADVAMYDRVCEVVRRSRPLEVRLSANFRSVPTLIEWLNSRFESILGVSRDGRPFDPATGVVHHQRIEAGRAGTRGPAVHVLPLELDGGRHKVDEYRAHEARALPRYLRWLVESGDVEIEDPLSRQPRRVGWGDIAILAVSTWRLPMLFPRLDAEGIPYASRGGTLFLEDGLHRQFLLGLRAIADRDDGVAEAALLRPPFFAVDPLDLLLAAGAGADGGHEPVLRAREAQALVRELRRRRFERAPGTTARDLLERTAFGRSVALGPNGAQRLARLRELCLLLEQTAAEEGLDYDAVTARLRDWVGNPGRLDPPYPVGADAVQVLTVHQAKGLEFPVVVLWDGKGAWDTRLPTTAWRIERDGHGWVMDLERLQWEEPAGLGLARTERAYREAERRRVVYVAATRARDVLVVPRAAESRPGKIVCADLLDGADRAGIRVMEPYATARPPSWARGLPASAGAAPVDGAALERDTAAAWAAAAGEAARPRFAPGGVAGEVDGERGDLVDPAQQKPRAGRFGAVFGTTVHQAIGLVLREPGLVVEEAVRRAAAIVGLHEHLAEAADDVSRALAALRAEGVAAAIGDELQIEYPVGGAWDGGRLLSGYIDLLAVTTQHVDVVDFKTDAPGSGAVEHTHPGYVAQIQVYGRLLQLAGVVGSRQLRVGLLFTADGGIRWVGSQGAPPHR